MFDCINPIEKTEFSYFSIKFGRLLAEAIDTFPKKMYSAYCHCHCFDQF